MEELRRLKDKSRDGHKRTSRTQKDEMRRDAMGESMDGVEVEAVGAAGAESPDPAVMVVEWKRAERWNEELERERGMSWPAQVGIHLARVGSSHLFW